MKYYITLLSTIMLSSCFGNNHPKMLSFTPASVMVDFNGNDLYEVTRVAQQFCDSIKKDAQYVRTEESGWVFKNKAAFFNCIESSAKNSSPASSGHIINNVIPPVVNNNNNKQ